MDNKYDSVIISLKVISLLPRNRRLRTNSNGFFTLEDNHLLVPIRRKIYGEGRDRLLKDIKSLLIEIKGQIKTLLSNKHLDGYHEGTVESGDKNGTPSSSEQSQQQQQPIKSKYSISDEKRTVLEQLSCIHREMYRSLTGFENLKSTYSSDILMVGELEHIMDTIRSYMNEIEQKVPDVAENISPVLLEKNE